MIVLRDKNFGLIENIRNKAANVLIKTAISNEKSKDEQFNLAKRITYRDKTLFGRLETFSQEIPKLKIKLKESGLSKFNRDKDVIMLSSDDCLSFAHEIGHALSKKNNTDTLENLISISNKIKDRQSSEVNSIIAFRKGISPWVKVGEVDSKRLLDKLINSVKSNKTIISEEDIATNLGRDILINLNVDKNIIDLYDKKFKYSINVYEYGAKRSNNAYLSELIRPRNNRVKI